MIESRTHIRLVAVTLIVVVALALVGSAASAAGPPWSEAGLKAGGLLAEVNAGAGLLVVSDSRANEVWRIDPLTGAYTVYGGLTGVIDARPDAAGHIWVTDWSAKALVRIEASGAATSWRIEAWGLWGLNFDNAGRVWVADSFSGQVFRFNPANRQLCAYMLPDLGSAEYIVHRDGVLWLGDYVLGRIVRFTLDPVADAVDADWWEVGSAAWPEGLGLDADNNVWFADYGQPYLSLLNPTSNRLTRYTPPVGARNGMVAVVDGRPWYTGWESASVGVLDPAVAVLPSVEVGAGSTTLSPVCATLAAGTQPALTTRTGTLAFGEFAPTLLADAGGWTVYGLPAGSRPWGIAQAAGSLWIADGGRQKLLRVSESPIAQRRLYLPLVQ